jgi:hypothetical protein
MSETEPETGSVVAMKEGTITMRGNWQGPSFPPIRGRREIQITLGHRRLFGIEWWAERLQLTAEIDEAIVQSEGFSYLDASMRQVSPIVTIHAEWWRRLGYALVRRLPVRAEPPDAS